MRHIWLALFFLNSLAVCAQTDTVRIATFELIVDKIDDEVIGVQLETIDLSNVTLKAGKSISDVLQTQSTVTMRGYGPGSSFGLSIRGGSTGQSQVRLDDIPFENPSLGSTDLSLIPVAAFSEMSVYRGGASAYLGSGAVGGGLLLNSQNNLSESELSQSLEVGSFGQFNSVTSLNLASDKLRSKTVFYFQEAQNDFDRIDPTDRDAMEPQPHAFFKANGVVQKFDYDINSKQKLGVFLWYYDTYRQLPPIESKHSAETSQTDENYRLQANYAARFSFFDLDIAGALDGGNLEYRDGDFVSPSENRTYHLQAKASKRKEKWEAYVQAIYRASEAKTNNYETAQTRTSPAILGGWISKYYEGKTKVSVTVRQEFLDGKAIPVVPVLGIEQSIGNGFNVHASAGKSYRVPGLNDLHWSPGGNPDLKPESGWFQELGIGYELDKENTRFAVGIDAYHRLIENWIQWAPRPSYWTAQNLKEVRAYGGEFHLTLSQKLSQFKLNHHWGLAYVQAINEPGEGVSERIEGKQLIYTPAWTLSAAESVDYKGYQLTFRGYFESERFVQSDNNRSLDPYFLLDVELGKRIDLKRHGVHLFAAARNVFDQEYQLRAAHPMPGVNFEIGLKLNYKLKSKTNNEN